jgi:hypothetical protein
VLGEVIERGVDEGGGVDAFAAPMVILRGAETVCPLASVTAKVNVLVPALAGVPDRTPEALKPRPVLQEPEQPLIAQLYGDVPPAAEREVLYGLDTTPLGRVLGEIIARGEGVAAVAIVIVADDEAVRPFASVTTKAKVLVPVFAGVPDKTPD